MDNIIHMSCFNCWHSLLQLNYNSIFSYMISMNQPIKRSYYETLYPLQRLLIILVHGNIQFTDDHLYRIISIIFLFQFYYIS